jgi:acetyl esterase/lipase
MPAAELARLSRRGLLAALAGVGAGACTRVEFIAANIPASFGAYTRRVDVAYGPLPQHRLDVYVPDRQASGPHPVVVFWHGGRWTSGDKSDYRFVGAAIAELGCTAILPNYRHYPEVKLPGFMADTALAAAWAAGYATQDGPSRRLFLMGHSSGAHMAVLVALDPRYLAAAGAANAPIAGVIGLSGPYDFLPLLEPDLQDMFGPPERYPDSQPVNYVRADAPPMLLVQGGRDDTVAPRNAQHLAAALRARGAAVTLLMYPTLGHGDTVAALSEPARRRAPILREVGSFIAQRT